MYKLVYCEKVPTFPYIKEFGGFNELPSPHSVIDWHEYFHLDHQVFDHQEMRQVLEIGGVKQKHYKNVNLKYGHTLGLGIVQPSSWDLKNGKLVWNEEPIYLRIGCEHKWEEKNKEWCVLHKIAHYGKCYHVQQCLKCAMIESYDSSD